MMSAGTLERSSAARDATAPRSIADISLSAPPCFPLPARPPTHSVIGVRAPFRITTSSRAIGGARFRWSLFPVFVEAASGLPAHVPRQDHSLQKGRRGEVGLAELLEHDVGDGIGRVE